jgi:phage/plasmid-like protein (TIGR03299 family)
MHGLEVSIDGFQVAFAARNEPGWHQLGTVFNGKLTTKQMLKTAHLAGWNVRLEDIRVPGIKQDRWATPQLAVVRDNPFDGERDVLGFVGDRYKVYQNEELLAFGDNLTDMGGTWETAGSIKKGRQVFATMELDRGIYIDPNGANDAIKNYLMLVTSHDGSTAVLAGVTPVRVVCQNTLNFALNGLKQSFKIRHTQTMEGKVQIARETLGLSFKYLDSFETLANSLYRVPMSIDQFQKVATSVYNDPGKDASKAAKTRWTNNIDRLTDIFTGQADGPNTTRNIAGTAWAGMNAMTESLDWYRTPRKGTAEGVATAASGLDPVTNVQKNKIKSAFMEFAGV